jgi:hypothetical protein
LVALHRNACSRTKFKKVQGEKDSAEQKYTKLPNLLQKFCTDDIYNADETGLFFVPRQMVP